MILHTISVSPASATFLDCLRLIDAGDGLLLLEDAVYALRDSTLLDAINDTDAQLYALADHTLAAGLGEVDYGEVRMIDMQQFVALTVQYPRQLAWY
ncbi:MAG: sulfurtransferase complex subunit TusB [Pseudomonadota bacterium]